MPHCSEIESRYVPYEEAAPYIPGKMHWTEEATWRLIEEYKERKDDFRNPEFSKRDVWANVVSAMKEKGFTDLNEELLDRKWRNMKKTFLAIKFKTKKKNPTGRDRIKWAYLADFEDIYKDDETINVGPTTHYFARKSPTPPRPVPSSDSVADDDDYLLPHDFEEQTCDARQITSRRRSRHDSYSSPNTAEDETPAAKKRRQSRLAYQCNKQKQKNFEAKMRAMEKFTNAIIAQNKIQKERNEILKKFVEKM